MKEKSTTTCMGDYFICEGYGPKRYIIAEGLTQMEAKVRWIGIYLIQANRLMLI